MDYIVLETGLFTETLFCYKSFKSACVLFLISDVPGLPVGPIIWVKFLKASAWKILTI